MRQEYFKSEEYLKSLADKNGQCDLGRFTVINNAIRDENELGEMLAATGSEYLIDAVTFNPEHIALLYSTAIIQTEARLIDENHLHSAVKQLYSNNILPQINEFKEKNFETIVASNSELVNQAFKRYAENKLDLNNDLDRYVKKTYNTVQQRVEQGLYVPGKYNAGETLESIVRKTVEDYQYKKTVNKSIEDMVERSIKASIAQNEPIKVGNADKDKPAKTIKLQALSSHKGGSRKTFIIAGPPACGKGSINSMVEKEAKSKGIEWDDVVKLNTDNHRAIVSIGQKLGPNVKAHANLNNDESSFITTLANNRLNQKINNGNAPHVFFDAVRLKRENIEAGLANQGEVDIKVVTLKPEIAVNRAQIRGEETGRYVPVNYMLNAHKNIGYQITDVLKSYPEKNINLEVYDSDVALGEKPILVQKVGLLNREANIYNIQAYGEIYGRKVIDADARNVTNIYPARKPVHNYDQLGTLTQKGYKLNIIDDVPAATLMKNILVHSPEANIQSSVQIIPKQAQSSNQTSGIVNLIVSTDGRVLFSSKELGKIMPSTTEPSIIPQTQCYEPQAEYSAGQVIEELLKQKISLNVEFSEKYDQLYAKCEKAKVPFTLKLAHSYKAFEENELHSENNVTTFFEKSIGMANNQLRLGKVLLELGKITVTGISGMWNYYSSEKLPNEKAKLILKINGDEIEKLTDKLHKVKDRLFDKIESLNQQLEQIVSDGENELIATIQKVFNVDITTMDKLTKAKIDEFKSHPEVKSVIKKFQTKEQQLLIDAKTARKQQILLNDISDIEYSLQENFDHLDQNAKNNKPIAQSQIDELVAVKEQLKSAFNELCEQHPDLLSNIKPTIIEKKESSKSNFVDKIKNEYGKGKQNQR